MKNRKVRTSIKVCAIALGAILGIAAPAIALTNAFANNNAKSTTSSTDYELVDNMQDAAILHCWNWSYDTIEDNMKLIAECGYSAIQTSPVTQPKDYTYDGEVGMEVGVPGKGGSGNWWKVYQPVTISVCDNGETWFGTKEEFVSMCETAESYGIKVIVDVVANHMGNVTGWKNSLSDISPQVGTYWNEDMLTNESYWHINDLQVWMSDGREHITQGSMGMPDLNTANATVQQYFKDYLIELIDCGVDGFRFDAAKHIETPDDDPAYASDFWPNVLNPAKSYYASKTGDELYVYGEILNMVGENFSIDSYTKYMSVTDNSAGNHLFDAFRNNNIQTLNLNYAAEKSVLWAESHDTYMNEASRYGSDKSIVRTWALVANKDNAASLFFVRPYYSYETLNDDVDGSFRGDLETSLTPAIMGECETYIWATNEVAAINHFNNRFVNYTDNTGVDGRVAYCVRGEGIILVNFNGAGTVNMSSHGLADGTYTDEVSGNTFKVSGGNISGNIESEYGIAVIYKDVMPNPGHDYGVQITSSVGDGSVFYSDSLEVTFTAKYADTAEYSVSTGENGTFTGDVTLNIGAGLESGEQITVTIKAYNYSSYEEKSYTFEKAVYDLSGCVFVENDYDWSKVTAYMWNDTGASITNNGGWPGEAMFECDADNNIYALSLSGDYNKIIFSNSGSSQTADLNFPGEGYCYDLQSGSWYVYYEGGDTPTPDPVYKTPTIVASAESSLITGAKSVTYTVTDAESATYSIDGAEEVSFNGSVTLTVGKNVAEGATQTVVIKAVNGDKSNTKIYSYEMDYTEPTVAASVGTTTTTASSLSVTFTVSNASDATITINGVEESFSDSVTKTLTTTSTIVLKAVNGTKNTTATYVYTFEKTPDNTTTYIYIDVSQCTWFGNDNAVAAIKFDTQTAYEKCITETVNGTTYYKAEIPTGAKSFSLCRMLPSGATYNAVFETLSSGKNLWTAYSGMNGGSWSYSSLLDGNDYSDSILDDGMMTVKFTNNYSWSGTIKAYYWGSSEKSVSWPGEVMTSLGSDVYEIRIPDDITGLIFTNGSLQTVDITTNLTDGIHFYISGNNSGKYTVSTK